MEVLLKLSYGDGAYAHIQNFLVTTDQGRYFLSASLMGISEPLLNKAEMEIDEAAVVQLESWLKMVDWPSLPESYKRDSLIMDGYNMNIEYRQNGSVYRISRFGGDMMPEGEEESLLAILTFLREMAVKLDKVYPHNPPYRTGEQMEAEMTEMRGSADGV